MHVIETARLVLRRFTESDAPFVRALLNEPSFIENIADRGVRTDQDAVNYLLGGPMASYERHGFGLLHVALRSNGTPIGMCGLLKRDTLDHPDIGYALLPEFWGAGYAAECAQAVINAGWELFHPERIVAITKPDNDASIRVLERLGFRFDGFVRATPDGGESRLFVLESPNVSKSTIDVASAVGGDVAREIAPSPSVGAEGRIGGRIGGRIEGRTEERADSRSHPETPGRVRLATLGDTPTLVSLMREFYAESGYPLPERAATEAFESLIRQPSVGRVYLMVHEEVPAGYAVLTVSFSMEFGALRGFVDDLFVASRYRRLGLGGEVVARIERDAVALGVRALLVETSSENGPAVSVYERQGFRDSGRMLMSKALGEAVHERGDLG